MRSRKKIVRSRPRHRADEFVPKLLKVMNISYTDAHRFRVPETGGEMVETISRDPPPSPPPPPPPPPLATQEISPTDSTKLTELMNLSYMNTETFRSRDGKK